MIKKCMGCGAIMQSDDATKEGYIKDELYGKSDLCLRCFKIKNYGEYTKVKKTNSDFLPILDTISKTGDLVVLLIDLFNIPYNINKILSHIDNPVLLVFTKRDILPLSVSDEKLINYSKNFNIPIIDTFVISSFKNYNFDLLMDKINEYKKTDRVYVVGYTNAGKSTMINKIIYNYFDNTTSITTSMIPSTTLDTIEISLNGLTLIDTPGILDENSYIEKVDYKDLKKITPRREIKPTTYQIKAKQTIFISDLARIDALSKCNITIYVSNDLKLERTFKNSNKLNEYVLHKIILKESADIVISGLGFIKATSGEYDIYALENVAVFTRDCLI